MKNKGHSYASRARALRRLGFVSYRDYLDSVLWQQVRERVFTTKGRRCLLCNCVANQVHHNRYHEADLTGRRTKHLVPLCDACHKSIHFNGDEFRTVVQTKREFKVRRRVVREDFEQRRYLSALFLNFEDGESHTAGELRFIAGEINSE